MSVSLNPHFSTMMKRSNHAALLNVLSLIVSTHGLTSHKKLSNRDLPRLALTSASKAEQIPGVALLSRDPLVYLVPDVLSPEECLSYQEYVQEKTLERSNPPQVTLEFSKLWPLPILALFSGLLPIAKNEAAVGNDLLLQVVSTIGTTLVGMVALAYVVVLPILRFTTNQSARTSVAVALNQLQDLSFIDPLVTRISDFADHSYWEAPVVTRYDTGAVFAKHHDASANPAEWSDLGGQRVVTAIIYLNDAQGGATYFDQLDIRVKPRTGQALLFLPSIGERVDKRMTHESERAESEKYIVQLFGRVREVPPPLGIPKATEQRKVVFVA